MPLPVIHSFAGYSVHKLSKNSKTKWQWVRLAVLIVLANLADFDLLPGIFKHHALLYHRGFSHSIGAVLLCGLLVAFIAVTISHASFRKTFILSTCAYFSHVVLDFFSAPVPMFWPLSSKRVVAPFVLFMGGGKSLHYVSSFKGFIYWFLSHETIRVLFFEMAIVCSIMAFVSLFNDARKQVGFNKSVALVRFAQAVIFFAGFMVAS